MADGIKAGDTFGNFRVTSVTRLHELGETAVMLVHKPTGLRWLHFLADDRVSSCAIAVVTPVADDRGLPHVLEHMVFERSKRWPGTDLLRGMLHRTATEDLNGEISPFMTNYHFSSALESDMRAVFEVLFNAILRPELSDTAFLREAGRFLPQDAAHPEGPLTFTGVVFNEMRGKHPYLAQRIEEATKGLLVPGTCFSFAVGGLPSSIMTLAPEDIRAYHERWYCPSNMRIATRGREAPRNILSLADALLKGVAPGEPAPPFALPSWWNGTREATIAVSADATTPSGNPATMQPNRGVLWMLPDRGDLRISVALNLFFEVYNPFSVLPLYESCHAEPLSDSLGPYRCCGFFAHLDPGTPADALRNDISGNLIKIMNRATTTSLIADKADLCNYYGDFGIGSEFGSGLASLARERAFHDLFVDWIFNGDPLIRLAPTYREPILRQFMQNPDSVIAIVKDALIDNPHCLNFSIQTIPPESDPEKKAIAALLAEKRASLSNEDCRELARREERIDVALPTQSAGAPLPETTLADISPDKLSMRVESVTDLVCGATFLTIRERSDGSAWLAGAADLSDLNPEQIPLLPKLVEAFRNGKCGHAFHGSEEMLGPFAIADEISGAQRHGLNFVTLLDPDEQDAIAEHFASLFNLRDQLPCKKAMIVAELLHNPARWSFALLGPDDVIGAVRASILEVLRATPSSCTAPSPKQKIDVATAVEGEWKSQKTPGQEVAGTDATLEVAQEISEFASGAEWTADDVRRAVVALARHYINWTPVPHLMVRECLMSHIARATPGTILKNLENAAAMNPDEIKNTFLKAQKKGI